MRVIATDLPGVVIVEPDVFGDSRGYFCEVWNHSRYANAGLPASFVQDNISFSFQGVLRGLHYQNPNSQGKLVYVLRGEVFDVAVDIRVGSPTFGRWTGVNLSSANKRQLYIPDGFAHGFCVISASALFAYKCTDNYNVKAEGGIIWNDPGIGINWPVDAPVLSEKDRHYPRLEDILPDRLPQSGGVMT